MRQRFISLAIVATVSQAVIAQDEVIVANDTAEVADKEQLLALLDEQTAIATHTRMNADYVPGMVTVLRGDDLEARGVRTVWEALALVPGMEMAIEKTGRRKVLIRGLGNTWGSGNVKILLNDVSMNSAELGLADPVFNIAIEQVERIEVVRGPGSAVYGEYAYMGVINVITHADESRLFAFGGSFDTTGGGATLAYAAPNAPLKASFNLAGWRSSGADVTTGQDTLGLYGYQSLSYAPGPANEEVDAATAVFKLDYQRFSFLAQQSKDGLGDHFGINEFLPPDADRIVERTRQRTVNMRQEIPLGSALTAGIQMGWKEVDRRRDDLYVNPGNPASPHNPDVYLDSHHQETSHDFGADFNYTGWAKHTTLLAASTSHVRVDESWIRFNIDVGPVITIPEGTTRTIKAVTVQDEYRHSDLFTLTTGLRYDEYSDVGTNYSPRIAGVWRLNERNIVKAQYAQAFRPATLYELSNEVFYDTSYQPAQIETSELGYIFKGHRSETLLTAFYSRLDNLLVFSRGFGNLGATSRGLEWEQILHPAPHWALDGNISYVDTRDEASGEPFPGAAKWIANLGPAYERGNAAVTLQAHYVSGYQREALDARTPLDGYTTVDLTTSIYHLLAQGLYLRLGVKNLFDADVRYPASYKSYPDDLPRPGRNWWAQLSYRY